MQLKVKFIENNERDRVHEAFKKQPVWTKSGLNSTLNVSMERLKFILPTLAFYWTSGKEVVSVVYKKITKLFG